ncbi:hypothetical protein [Cyanobacterium sp. uoEpiScrs1]|uniref:hypothetical protein n=1 Tax=Cyanobacterium sp. uoEpiScrs1 TaxID=2976343 RepID=UPI0022698DDE|nr:hypothetical protein [Cyanobacterium sp. uoEpiScrs1]
MSSLVKILLLNYFSIPWIKLLIEIESHPIGYNRVDEVTGSIRGGNLKTLGVNL